MKPSTLKPKVKDEGEISNILPAASISKDLNKKPSTLKPKQENAIKNTQEKPSGFKETAQNYVDLPSTQIALGLTQAVTSPLDLFKMYMQGEALSALDEAEEVALKHGVPFDREAEMHKIMQGLEYLPTQSMAEDFIKKETGVDTGAKDRFSKVLRGISEFAGLTPKGAKLPKLAEKTLSSESQALRETGKKFGLKQIAGMEKELAPTITPIVSAKRQAKIASELQDTSKKAIDEIISEKIPVKKMQEKGVNLEEAYTSAYKAGRKTAADLGDKNVDISNVIDWIDNQLMKTKKSSLSPSNSQKIYMEILNKEKKSLLGKQPKSGSIDLITGKKAPPKPKPMNADQALNQHINFNENVKGIYRKPEFSGSEHAVKNAYAGLNEQLINSIDKTSGKLGSELKFANNIFSESMKITQVNEILKKSFKNGYDAKLLNKTLGNKRERLFLERSLGKDGVQDIEKIAKYGQAAQERVLKHLKEPDTIKDYLSKMTPLQLGLLVGFKSHVGSAFYIGKGALQRLNGYLMTREGTKKAYVDYMKQASKVGKNPAPLVIFAKKLEKQISKEFGSEENLLNMANQEEK